MINSQCGYQNLTGRSRLHKRAGCGVWVGFKDPGLGGFLVPAVPHFHNGVAYCATCIKGFKVIHLGQGVCVRPKEESDVPVGGPGLKELYDDPAPYKNKKQPTWPGLHVNRP